MALLIAGSNSTIVSFGQKLIANLRSHYEFAGMLQQEEQNPDWLFAQREPDAVLPEFSRANVELEQSEAI
jgi:hypothetical protein